ncbi:MAG: hypothetical protein FJ091_19790 [Deltaproteobacteria bacterium]|nr:hypothetical protein [Deltaproteobacteria bacterium]
MTTTAAGASSRGATRAPIHSGFAIAGALALLAILVAASFAWVWLWSTFLHANTTEAEAQAYDRIASPIVAFVLAAPLYFAAGRWLRTRIGARAPRTALALIGVDAALGVASLFTTPSVLYAALICALVTGVKLVAIVRGARAA